MIDDVADPKIRETYPKSEHLVKQLRIIVRLVYVLCAISIIRRDFFHRRS